MLAVKAVSYLLANNAPLLAKVPAESIVAGVIPLGVMPAVGVTHISTTEHTSIAVDDAQLLATSRIQVTAHAKSYADRAEILDLVRKALPVSRGTVNGVAVECITPEGVGPDIEDHDAGIYQQSRDFLVRFQQP